MAPESIKKSFAKTGFTGWSKEHDLAADEDDMTLQQIRDLKRTMNDEEVDAADYITMNWMQNGRIN